MTKFCSGGISNAWHFVKGEAPPFETCCEEHDEAYDKSGNAEDRKLADSRLRECIKDNGYPRWAFIMYWAVRLFGWLLWKNSKKQ